jgi:hypothetical protein
MDAETKTMVMIALPHHQSPMEPHTPGTYVLGYVDGDQDAANDYLNAHKQAKTNALVKNGFLIQTNVKLTPDPEGPQPNPQMPPNHPQQPKMKLILVHGFLIFPLTQMDNQAGLTYSMDVDTHWVFPTGSMVQDMETQMENCGKSLVENRSSLTLAGPGALAALNQQTRRPS